MFFQLTLHRQDILNASMLKITDNTIGENFPGTSPSLSNPGEETKILELSYRHARA